MAVWVRQVNDMTCDKCLNGKWIGTAYICDVKSRIMTNPCNTECEHFKVKTEQTTFECTFENSGYENEQLKKVV